MEKYLIPSIWLKPIEYFSRLFISAWFDVIQKS